MKKYNSFNLKWLVLWILIPLLTFSIAFGCAYAYFTATAKDKQGDFSTAMIRVNIADGMTTQAVSTDNDITTYILPGSRVQVSGRVQNTGSARIYVILEYRVMVQDEVNYAERGYYTLSGTRIEQNTQGEYITPASEIEAGDDTQFTLSYTFDPEIYDNSFVGKVVNIKVIAHAIQYANIADGVTATNLLIDKGESDMQMLRVSSNDETLGSVSQTGSFLVGQTVTLTASANDNVEFLGWRAGSTDGEWVSDELEYSFTVQPTSPNVYYAIFRDLSTSPLSYTYSGSNATVRATNPSTLSGELRIPSMVNNNGNEYSVTAIYSSSNSNTGAFHSAQITSAYIPTSVTSIGAYAFRSCRNMTDLTIQSNVVSIGQNAFEYCEDLSDIVIPASVTNIGTYAFSGTLYLDTVTFEQGSTISTLSDGIFSISGLQSINIPDSVTSIGSHAFAQSNRLRSISLPANLTSIGATAFEDCTSLTSITIPSKVISIGDSAFSGCTAVSMINFNATNMSDLAEDNNVFMNVGRDTGGTILNVGDNVTRIPNYIFCTPNSGANAPNITILNFAEDSVCSSIGTMAFVDCIYLSQITIPENVTSIQDDAFWNCTGLTEINFNATNMADCTATSDLFGAAGKESTGITVNVGANVTRIPDYLFYPYEGDQHIPNIDSINFAHGSECTEIGDFAFYNCQPLTSLNLSDSLETIGESAFYGATSLLSLTIPESVQTIGQYAFGMASALENLQYNAINANDVPLTIDMGNENEFPSPFFSAGGEILNSNMNSNLIIYIGENVQRIPNWMLSFTCATNIIYNGNAVSSIGIFAFTMSLHLDSITIPDGVTYIGYTAYYGAENVNILNYNAISANDYDMDYASGDTVNVPPFYGISKNLILNIGENVEYIPEYMFAMMTDSNSLTINFLGSQVTEIGEGAFEYNNEISALTIPSSVQKIGPSVLAECVPSSITFENTEGWSVSESEDMSDSTSVDVTNPTNNSILFTSTYVNYYWQREDLPPEPQYTQLDFTIEDGVITGYTGTESNVVIPSTYSIVENTSPEIRNITITEEQVQILMNTTDFTQLPNDLKIIMLLIYIGGEYYVDGKLIGMEEFMTRVEMGPYPINAEITYTYNIENSSDSSLMSLYMLSSIAMDAVPGLSDYKSAIKGTINTKTGIIVFNNPNEFLSWFNGIANGTIDLDSLCPMTVNIEPYREGGGPAEIIVEGTDYLVTGIGNSAFAGNEQITSVQIPNSVTSIDSHAFTECILLSQITIPESVSSMGTDVFTGCSALTDIEFERLQYWWVSEGENDTEGITLDVTNSSDNVTRVTTTYAEYYWHMTNYEPDPLILNFTILDGTIYSYTGPDYSVVIPNTYSILEQEIHTYTLYNNPTLSLLIDPIFRILMVIGGDYYINASNEKYSIDALSELMLEQAYPIELEFTYELTYQNYSQYYDETSDLGLKGLEDLLANEIISPLINLSGTISTAIGEVPFNSNEEYLTWYASATASEEAFNALCPMTLNFDPFVAPIAIGGEDYVVTSITNMVFTNDNVISVRFREGSQITNIESTAFYASHSLVEIVNESSISFNVGDYGTDIRFNPILEIVTDKANSKLVTINGNIYKDYNGNRYFIKNIDHSTKIEIDSSATQIYQYALDSRSDITSVTIPEDITVIGERAFNDTLSLTEINFNATNVSNLQENNNVFYHAGQNSPGITVNIGANVTKIPAYIFYPYNPHYIISGDSPNIISVNFEDGSQCREIGSYSFAYCNNLTNLTIPSSVTSIGSNAFDRCYSLVEVVNLSNVTFNVGSYGTYSGTDSILEIITNEIDSKLVTINGNVYKDYNGERYFIKNIDGSNEIEIDSSATQIYQHAFIYRSDITSVVIPSSVYSIGEYALYNCSALSSVTFEETNGWWVSTDNTATSGTSVTVTDPAQNATYFRSTYYNYYWKRN